MSRTFAALAACQSARIRRRRSSRHRVRKHASTSTHNVARPNVINLISGLGTVPGRRLKARTLLPHPSRPRQSPGQPTPTLTHPPPAGTQPGAVLGGCATHRRTPPLPPRSAYLRAKGAAPHGRTAPAPALAAVPLSTRREGCGTSRLSSTCPSPCRTSSCTPRRRGAPGG